MKTVRTWSRQAIRQKVHDLHAQVWHRREELVCPGASEDMVLRTALDLVPSVLLGFDVRKIEEIPSDGHDLEIAGIVDRAARQIVVAQKFKFEWRRFTIAHEIGHIVLHPDVLLHRERPLKGGESLNPQRPRRELEADWFAADFLMPHRYLKRLFHDYFGGCVPLSESEIDDNFTYLISEATGRDITPISYRKMDPIERAKLFASMSGFGGNFFEPLERRFAVSRTAMAIRLHKIGLVQ